MPDEISILRKAGRNLALSRLNSPRGDLNIYLYPPFAVLLNEPEGETATCVLRSGQIDRVLFVTDQQTRDILAGLPKHDDPAAVTAALKNFADLQGRTQERQEAESSTPGLTGAPGAASWAAQVLGDRAPQVTTAPTAQGTTAPAVVRTPTRKRSAAAKRAHDAATLMEVVAWLGAVIGTIVGIAIALHTEPDANYGPSTHPNVVLGLSIAVGSLIQGLMMVMISAYIASRTE